MSRFTEREIATVYRAMRKRRDMRHFLPDPVDPLVLTRLLKAAHLEKILALEPDLVRASPICRPISPRN
jgi:hypothetical protein